MAENLVFAEIMGHLFELGFNTGLIATMRQRTDLHLFTDNLFTQDFTKLHLSSLVETAQKRTGTFSGFDRDRVRDWVTFVLLKGYLAGSNFLAEFLHTIRQSTPEPNKWHGDVCYLQCSFTGKNSLETLPIADRMSASRMLMDQFGKAGLPAISLSFPEMEVYTDKGAFLNADTLILLRDAHGWRVLCIDLSVFGLLSLDDTHNLQRHSSLRSMLRNDLHYLRTRSVFTNLSIDTNDESTAQELLSGQIKHYFTAFKRHDKETVKCIQAASYTASFYDFLLEKHIVRSDDALVFHIVGYTDRAMNALTLKPTQLPLLRTCQEIYQQKHQPKDITKARQEVIGAIQRAANQSFQQTETEQFGRKLLGVAKQADGLNLLTYEETLTDLVSTLTVLKPEQLPPDIEQLLPPSLYEGQTLRDVHRALVQRELASPDRYLFLTGHPGIGKTSSLAKFLQERAKQDEGFLLFYASPRSEVNREILKTFQEGDGCKNFFGLTTNTLVLRAYHGRPAVLYESSLCEDQFKEQGVVFAPAKLHDDVSMNSHSLRQLAEIQENLLVDQSKGGSGVLKSLCDALAVTLTEHFPAARTADSSQARPLSIVATVAIQSLKRTPNGENTLKHLKTILKSVTAQDKPIPAKMRQLAQRLRYIVVMIDEITGDEGGAEFLDGMHRFLQQYDFSAYGIQTKIVVADASIVDKGVIHSHLESTGFEPQKIYFRRADPTQVERPLIYERMDRGFKRCKSVLINANAYPASALHLSYRVLTDSFCYEEETYQKREQVLRKRQQDLLAQDIMHSLDTEPETQTLVYIQDKKRLSELIALIAATRKFERGTEYQEIHANLSEKQKQEVKKTRDQVQVVFMTASASRGLSFKRAKHILVDIPHFALEQNLMEILQVIYRGRGGPFDLDEKRLTFYLADHLLYLNQADRELVLKEHLLTILNVFLILKTAILTRITGSGPLGRRHFRMIPIGGKSLNSASQTFSEQLSDLLRELEKIAYPSWANKRMLSFIRSSVQALLEQSDLHVIRIGNASPLYRQPPRSYIEQLATFAGDFEHAAERGFDRLITLPVLEQAYLVGGLLIIPMSGKSLRELYQTALMKVTQRPHPEGLPDLLACMEIIRKDPVYPENLRSALLDAILFLKTLQSLDPNSAYYEQESTPTDLYCAFPLSTFPAYHTLQTYFNAQSYAEELEDLPFRVLLERTISACYPADGFLPIGKNYKTFPFVLFRSFQLGETRQKIFTEKYLFSSQEFNIINMLLSQS